MGNILENKCDSTPEVDAFRTVTVPNVPTETVDFLRPYAQRFGHSRADAAVLRWAAIELEIRLQAESEGGGNCTPGVHSAGLDILAVGSGAGQESSRGSRHGHGAGPADKTVRTPPTDARARAGANTKGGRG
jgi:hypothetical protein